MRAGRTEYGEITVSFWTGFEKRAVYEYRKLSPKYESERDAWYKANYPRRHKELHSALPGEEKKLEEHYGHMAEEYHKVRPPTEDDLVPDLKAQVFEDRLKRGVGRTRKHGTKPFEKDVS